MAVAAVGGPGVSSTSQPFGVGAAGSGVATLDPVATLGMSSCVPAREPLTGGEKKSDERSAAAQLLPPCLGSEPGTRGVRRFDF